MTQKSKAVEEIGVRELKARASDVIRAVRERRIRYVVTYRGTPVAVIAPIDSALPQKDTEEPLQKVLELRKRMKKTKHNSVEILSEMRR
ncbi:MAG: type II toxin-antitoxin system Phd/YefM family antitoxin [Anaerolineales bacterium]|nr:type II toxin-antitoxin system Phd/YefM family antitoxin [Anaerolineales bacterium]